MTGDNDVYRQVLREETHGETRRDLYDEIAALRQELDAARAESGDCSIAPVRPPADCRRFSSPTPLVSTTRLPTTLGRRGGRLSAQPSTVSASRSACVAPGPPAAPATSTAGAASHHRPSCAATGAAMCSAPDLSGNHMPTRVEMALRDEVARLADEASDLRRELADRAAKEARVWQRIQTWNDDPVTRLEGFALSHERLEEMQAQRDEARAELAEARAAVEAMRALANDLTAKLAEARSVADQAIQLADAGTVTGAWMQRDEAYRLLAEARAELADLRTEHDRLTAELEALRHEQLTPVLNPATGGVAGDG